MNTLKSENHFLKKYIQDQKCQRLSLNNHNQLNKEFPDSFEELDNFSTTTNASSQIDTQINNNFNNYFYSYSNLTFNFFYGAGHEFNFSRLNLNLSN